MKPTILFGSLIPFSMTITITQNVWNNNSLLDKFNYSFLKWKRRDNLFHHTHMSKVWKHFTFFWIIGKCGKKVFIYCDVPYQIKIVSVKWHRSVTLLSKSLKCGQFGQINIYRGIRIQIYPHLKCDIWCFISYPMTPFYQFNSLSSL